MNRHTILILGLLAAAFATATPQVGLTQSSPLIGTWKLNLAKSKFSPGPPPKSQTLTFEGAGQDLKNTAETIDARDHRRTRSGDKDRVHAYLRWEAPPNNGQRCIRRNHLHASRRLSPELGPFES